MQSTSDYRSRRKAEKPEDIKVSLVDKDGGCVKFVKFTLDILSKKELPDFFFALEDRAALPASSTPPLLGVKLTFEAPLSNVAVGPDVFLGTHKLVKVTRKSKVLPGRLIQSLTFIFVEASSASIAEEDLPLLASAEAWLKANCKMAFNTCNLYQNQRQDGFPEICVNLQGMTGLNNPRITFEFKPCGDECCQ